MSRKGVGTTIPFYLLTLKTNPMRLYTLILAIMVLGVSSCQKEEINPTVTSYPESTIVLDSTYGDYELVNMIYVDSVGNETSNPTTNMEVEITPTDINLSQLGVEMESFQYTPTTTSNAVMYDIAGGYGPPCNNYYIVHDTLSMYYISIPTNGVGCYRLLKAIKQ